MKRYFNTGSYRVTLILILFLTCFTYKSNAQNIQVQATISKTTIPIGEQAILYISARVPQKTDVTFPVLADSIISKLQIVKTSKPDTSFDKSSPGEEIITRSYTITSFDANLYVIPQYTIHTKAGDLKTNILTLQVTAVKVDTTKAVYDIKQPFAVSYNIFDWLKDNWLWVAIGLGIVLLIVGIVYYLKKRPKKEVIKKSVPVIPDHVIALNKLSELRDKKLWQQNEVKLYYSELTDVVREYLEKRYNIKAHEQTTDEIFEGLKHKEIAGESRNKLKGVLTLADLVKFAKAKPSAEDNEQSMEEAISFIMLTKQEARLPENKEELKK